MRENYKFCQFSNKNNTERFYINIEIYCYIINRMNEILSLEQISDIDTFTL